jgi:hypothetical protein
MRILIALSLLAAACAQVDRSSEDDQAAATAASSALTGIPAEISGDDGSGAAKLTDGGHAVYFVRLDELKSYARGAPVDALLHDVGEREAITARPSGKLALLTMLKENGKWRASRIGDSAGAKVLSDSFAQAVGALGQPQAPQIIVRVPAIYAELVGQRVGTQLYLLPTQEIAGLQAGQPVKAADAFAALAQAAQTATSAAQ